MRHLLKSPFVDLIVLSTVIALLILPFLYHDLRHETAKTLHPGEPLALLLNQNKLVDDCACAVYEKVFVSYKGPSGEPNYYRGNHPYSNPNNPDIAVYHPQNDTVTWVKFRNLVSLTQDNLCPAE